MKKTKFEKEVKKEKQLSKNNRGITLVALVVTIVVLIILATISINAVIGENGIIRRAQQAKEANQNAIISESEALNTLLEEYNNAIAEPVIYQDDTLPTAPKLAQGMTRVKYNSISGKWERVTDVSAKWYDYASDKKEWANVVLGDATFNSDGTLDESKPYSQLVWIPRFAYQITSQYHTASDSAGNINVVFIDENNQNKEKTKTYSTTYPSATAGAITGMNDYVVHPAFDYDGKHLSGFWIGKFESSHTGCTTDKTKGQSAFTGNEVMTIKANVTSWRMISIGDAFTTCLNMNKSGNPYGLHSSDNVVDPHMIKNDEWGAVAYLSKSIYGKNTEEVYINNSSDYITGNAGGTTDADAVSGIINAYNTTGGIKASTTGTIYGIYDMSGGNWERVAAYINNGHNNLTNGTALVNAASKYKNVYTATATNGNDTEEGNYNLSTPTNGHYGDAVYEISGSYTGQNAWYKDYSDFPVNEWPFFGRGGVYHYKSLAGMFFFHRAEGNAYIDDGFRVVVPVL